MTTMPRRQGIKAKLIKFNRRNVGEKEILMRILGLVIKWQLMGVELRRQTACFFSRPAVTTNF
jgi:hypothetical protein